MKEQGRWALTPSGSVTVCLPAPGFKTQEMLQKSRSTSKLLGYDNVEFREGLAEKLPIEDGWADVVISNGVINLCADKRQVFSEIYRVLKPGGRLQFADIANGKPVPESAMRNIDLWTA